MKGFIAKLLLVLFCSFILSLTIKGIPGNPTENQLADPKWSETGPLEPSIEGGRFALLYSLVENKSVEFTKDIALLATPDLGYRNGKYISLFAPGVSMLAIPGYLIGKVFGLAQVGSFATVAFFAILNVLLLRSIAIRLGANQIASVIAALAFLFASPAFAYATTFYQHHVSTFLILLSIFILLRFKSFISLACVWLLYGIAFIVDYPNLILMFPIALYALGQAIQIIKKEKHILFNFSVLKVLAVSLIILPLTLMFWYNHNANGGPLKLSGTLDRVMSIDEDGIPLLGSDLVKEALRNGSMTTMPSSSFFSAFLNRHMLNGMYVLFISPDRGMLFYTPVMIFGLLSLFIVIKKWDKKIALLTLIMSVNVLLYSMWDDPQGGWAFGSRYLIPTYAILSIFIAMFLTKFKKNTFLLIGFFIILAYSTLVNSLGAISSHTNPPKHEAVSLEKEYKKEQKYTYLRNVDQILSGDAKSYVYRAYAHNYMSAWSYYTNISILLVIVFGFLLGWAAIYHEKKKAYQQAASNAYDTFKYNISIPLGGAYAFKKTLENKPILKIGILLSLLSIGCFIYYHLNGLGLAYNDARSHLDIGRRVVESLKPGFAQLGSVWLPLPHLLMTLTIWNDFMWHSGLAGAIQSMIAYVATGILIYMFLRRIGVGLFGRYMGVAIYALNLNILYMQSTAMTELPLIALMMAGVYELLIWHQTEKIFNLIKAAFWIMLSTLIRYDGWFLFAFATGLIFLRTLKNKGYKTAEGVTVIFVTLGGFGIFLWLLWNQLIFKDALYFAFGSFSANAQQKVIEEAGALYTKQNLSYSLISYIYAMVYNSNLIAVILSVIGAVYLWLDERIEKPLRIACLALISPFIFNVVALYFGHSVLFVHGLGGNSWFNVRYGLTMVPSIAIFVGYLLHRMKAQRLVILGLLLFVTTFGYINQEIVTLDDARIGLGGKNVTQVSNYLRDNATHEDGYVLISAAKHDAIIFSSGLPMKRFIHEGTGVYWDLATAHPEKWARWIIMRSDDPHDLTTHMLSKDPEFKKKYTKVRSYPFAEVFELKKEYLGGLQKQPKIAINN
jgi:hypothetical protein